MLFLRHRDEFLLYQRRHNADRQKRGPRMSGAAEGDPVSISAVEIRKIRGADTIDLRHRVMWPDKPKSHVVLPDDASATHFGSFVGGALIGVASFFPDGKVYRLRKLAVDEAFQSRGVASALIAHACGHLMA